MNPKLFYSITFKEKVSHLFMNFYGTLFNCQITSEIDVDMKVLLDSFRNRKKKIKFTVGNKYNKGINFIQYFYSYFKE